LAVFMAAGFLLVPAGGAFAAGGVELCIPEAEGAATVTPTKGACAAKYKLVELGAEGKEGKAGKEGAPGKEGKEGTFAGLTATDKETLLAVLPYIKFVKEGVDKKPTIKFYGANVQVVSGAAKETEINGLGNLVIGRDEEPGTQTGSNNLLLVSRWFNLFAVRVGGGYAYSYCCFNRVDRRRAVGAGELDAAPDERSGAGAAGSYRVDGRGGVVV
jgi:hypothetical protein